ncbi:hypothetical protein IB286_10345 [Spongiibacter sp. KMU-158]|uniref:Cupredoxin-like domain-containing protein n=1 Tax=Spongiibacter pelagi TaxID=2760804 RepID=A0A927C283_9GAMM|nr:hypothetical protein [Spongiibacter pelagi]MBD2859404.1 hypothetical protein [Spongiibacter pelagi]
MSRSLRLLLIIATVALLGGLWLGLKPQTTQISSDNCCELRWENGQKSGPDTIRVTQGDNVEIRIFSDSDNAVHLHGYELHREIPAGETAIMALQAEHSGRFMLELHNGDIVLAYLEVFPANQ